MTSYKLAIIIMNFFRKKMIKMKMCIEKTVLIKPDHT